MVEPGNLPVIRDPFSVARTLIGKHHVHPFERAVEPDKRARVVSVDTDVQLAVDDDAPGLNVRSRQVSITSSVRAAVDTERLHRAV